MTGLTQVLVAAVIFLLVGLFFASKQLGVQSGQIKTLTMERDDAKAQAKAAVESSKKHAANVAKSSKSRREVAEVVAAVPPNDCLDRRLPADLLHALGVREPAGQPAPAARPGATKSHPGVQGRNTKTDNPVGR